MSRIVQRVHASQITRVRRNFRCSELQCLKVMQRCGGLSAVLGYHSVFSPFIIEAIRSDALIKNGPALPRLDFSWRARGADERFCARLERTKSMSLSCTPWNG